MKNAPDETDNFYILCVDPCSDNGRGKKGLFCPCYFVSAIMSRGFFFLVVQGLLQLTLTVEREYSVALFPSFNHSECLGKSTSIGGPVCDFVVWIHELLKLCYDILDCMVCAVLFLLVSCFQLA